jgi:ribosomal RNA-processing protein 36
MDSDDEPTLGAAVAAAAARAAASAPPPPPQQQQQLHRKRAREVAAAAAEEEEEADEEEEEEDGEAAAAARAPAPARAAPSAASRVAPQEMTSRRPVGRAMRVVEVRPDPAARRRDPRFEAASGDFDAEAFRRSYAFVDELRDQEIAALRGELKKGKQQRQQRGDEAPAAAALPDVRAALARLDQQRAQQRQQQALELVLRRDRKARREAISAGKAPFFPKKSELRELAAVERFAAVEKEGGKPALNKLIARKRKKLLGKDKKTFRPRAAPVRGAEGAGGAR